MARLVHFTLGLVLATTAAGAAAPSADAPTERNAYLARAAASDLFEIQSSQVALKKSKRPDVREMANMLIKDHTNSTAQLTAAARSAGIAPPAPRLMPDQTQMMRRLQSASGAAFDRIYLQQQIPAHQKALALHQNYARNGDVPALRTVAGQIVPVVTKHLEHARHHGPAK